MNSFLRVLLTPSVLLAGIVSLGTVAVAPATPASAATGINGGVIGLGTIPLELVPDVPNSRVWVRGFSRVEVVDVSTGTVKGIDLSARELVVNADGSKAYVPDGSKIIEIDAATMTTRTFDMSSEECVGSLAAGAVKVHFSSCNGGAVLDPHTGELTASPISYGERIAVPGRDRVLYRSSTQLYVVDGSDSTVLNQRDFPTFGPPRVASDGTRLLFSDSSGALHVRDLDSLGPLTSMPRDAQASSSTIDLLGDLVLAARDGTSVYELETGTRINHLVPDSPERWVIETVTALGHLVVSGGRSLSGAGALFVESDPYSVAPDLRIDEPVAADAFTPTLVEGTLSDRGAPMAGEAIELTDDDGSPLATTTTDAGGRFATEIPPSTGTHLVARWAAGTARPAAVSYQYVRVPVTGTVLSISAPNQVSPTDFIPVSVHLQSANGSDAGGMTVDLYRRCDDAGGWQTVTSLITGSDGTANYSDSAAPCLEVEYLARHEQTQKTFAAAMVTSVMVTWRSSALELTAPDDVRVGDTATVRARLLIDGQPAANRSVTLSASDDAAAQSLVTDGDGRVAADIYFPRGGYQRVRWQFAGDDLVLPTWADTDVLVSRRGTTLSAEPSVTNLSVTETLTVSGVLTDERGEPVPNAELHLRHTGPEVLTHTAADGTYTAQVPAGSWDPDYIITVSYHGDPAHEATSDRTVVDVQPLWSSLSLMTDAARAAPGDEVALSGTLTTERNEDLSGEIVSVRRIDPDGTVTQLPAARLDAGGDYSFTDTPPVPGDVRYVVSHYGGNWYRTLEAETSLDVVPRVPAQLSLETDRNRYDAGDTATVRVAASAGDEVLLTAEHFNGDVTTVYRGPLPSAGLTKRVVVRHTTTFVAKVFQTVDHEAGSVSLTRPVRIGMTSTVPNAWGSTGGVRLVSPKVRPRFGTTVTPRRAGVCLRYEVQQRVEGGWRRRSSTCRWTDERGKATYTISRRPVGSRWRVRPVAQEDRLNAFTLGAWVEFRVRSRS